MSSKKIKILILSILFILMLIIIGILLFIVKPQIERIPNDFYYQAEIFSLDNFYNSELGDFEGQQISKTKFSYQAVFQREEILGIKNTFEVRQITGDKIFAIERLYGIDAKTEKHVFGYGDKNREGYLFAPRGINKEESYIYWHINYDSPAYMVFQNEEYLYGLRVYRYSADYHADQTQDLVHLPLVPEERGIELDINLQTWIEPITGRLIQYEDNTIAYYYNIETGERIYPWNKFNNRYRENSVIEQVKLAKSEKLKINLVTKIIPGVLIFIFICLSILLLRNPKKNLTNKSSKKQIQNYSKKPFYKWIIFFAIIVLLIIFIYLSNTKEIKVVGISQWFSNQEFLRNIEGFKAGLVEGGYVEGKNIKFITENSEADIEKQISIAESFIESDVDLIYSLTTTGTLIVHSATPNEIPMVFSIVTYPIEAGLIKSFESSENHHVGTTNYIDPLKQYSFFEKLYPNTKTLAFVYQKGEPSSVIRYREFKNKLMSKGIEVIGIEAFNSENLLSQLESNKDNIDAIYSSCDNLVFFYSKVIGEFTKKYKKPSFSCKKNSVINGALIADIADFYEIGKTAGKKAASVLNGAEPSSLPSENTKEDYIIINLKSAQELGINVPEDLLSQAKEIIRE